MTRKGQKTLFAVRLEAGGLGHSLLRLAKYLALFLGVPLLLLAGVQYGLCQHEHPGQSAAACFMPLRR